MGTRSLIAVQLDGEYKIAQYSQWDGYPEGNGIKCLHFLRDEMNEQTFRDSLSKLRWIDRERLNQIFYDYGGSEDGFIAVNKADKFYQAFPEFSRNTGTNILKMVQDATITTNCLQNSIEFAASSLWCEYAWVIDLDKRTFEAYEGYNKTELTEQDRFYFLRDCEDDEFHGVKLFHSWSLDDLPTDQDFLKVFEVNEDE